MNLYGKFASVKSRDHGDMFVWFYEADVTQHMQCSPTSFLKLLCARLLIAARRTVPVATAARNCLGKQCIRLTEPLANCEIFRIIEKFYLAVRRKI